MKSTMKASDSVSGGTVPPTTVQAAPRSSGDASTVGVVKRGTSRLSSRVADVASKPKMEIVEGSLRLEGIL